MAKDAVARALALDAGSTAAGAASAAGFRKRARIRTHKIEPVGGGSTTINTTRFPITTFPGSVTPQSWASTNLGTQLPSARVDAASGAGAIAGFRANTAQWWPGVGGQGQAHSSGVKCLTTFSFHQGITGVATCRAFIGMRASVVTPTDVDPATLTSVVGVGFDGADATWMFYANDSAGNCTEVALPSGTFPKPTADGVGVWELLIEIAPNGTEWFVQLTNLETDDVASTTFSTNIPAAANAFAPIGWESAGGTAVAGFRLHGLYMEVQG